MMFLTNVSPRIPRLVNLHSALEDVGRVAEEGKPHVLDMRVIKRLPLPDQPTGYDSKEVKHYLIDCSVERVSL